MSDNFENRKSKIDEVIGNSDDASKNSDAVRIKKEERLQKRKITELMRKKAIFYASVCALVMIIVFSVAVLIKSSVESDDADELPSTVLVIDGETISEQEFSFFCSMVVESESFESLTQSSNDTAKLSDSVKSVAVKNTEEFIGKVHEAKSAGIKLSDEEISQISSSIELASKGYSDKDAYCMKFYGLSYEDYINIRKQMALVSKYITHVSESADISVENQKKVYSENLHDFISVDVKMIYMDIRELDEEKISYKRKTAESLLHYIADGQDIASLSEEYSDENNLFNAKEIDGNSVIKMSKDSSDGYQDLFNAVSEMTVGNTELIETENEICVVYCVDKSDVEDALNSDELISYVKYDYAAEFFDSVMDTGKYSAKINEKEYKSVDISNYVETAKGFYTKEAN